MIDNIIYNNLILEPILFEWRNLLMTFPNISVKHIYCEANCCVNRLAKLGCTHRLYFVTFYNPLPVLVPFLTSDKVSLYIYIYIPQKQASIFPIYYYFYKNNIGKNTLLIPTFWVDSHFDLYFDFATIPFPKNKKSILFWSTN